MLYKCTWVREVHSSDSEWCNSPLPSARLLLVPSRLSILAVVNAPPATEVSHNKISAPFSPKRPPEPPPRRPLRSALQPAHRQLGLG